MGLVRPKPTLRDSHHGHARRCGPSIHYNDSATEGRQCRQVVEPNSKFAFRGQYREEGKSVARHRDQADGQRSCPLPIGLHRQP